MSESTRPGTTWEYVKETPPPSSRSNSGSQLYTQLEKLIADDDGEWTRIGTFGSRTGANSIVTSIRAGKRRIPDGTFEFTCRTNAAENWSQLWARYAGPNSDESQPTAPKAKPATKTAKKAADLLD